MKKKLSCIFKSLTVLVIMGSLVACGGASSESDHNTLSVGTIAGPETELMEVARDVAAEQYGLNIQIVEFEDYLTPNTALAEGMIDANASQTLAYFDEVVQSLNLPLVAIADTFTYPIGIYSERISSLNDIADNSQVGIPNELSNGARALLLLQDAGLIQLDASKGFNVTIYDVIDNPHHLNFIEINAAQLPRSLQDLDIAIINTNYAMAAGMVPSRDAIYLEGTDSPYVNIIAVRSDKANNPLIQDLIAAFQSDEVAAKGQELFQGQAIPAWAS